MTIGKTVLILTGLAMTLSGCGAFGSGDANQRSETYAKNQERARQQLTANGVIQEDRSSIFDLFGNKADPNTTVEVNKYIWAAALDVLDFMPIESADPFTGTIVMGYGTAPGSSRAYRATVFVRDPALDARSLNVALATRSGPASADVQREVENAILTRARQLRIRDSKL
ncbi:DUF3576 domain-containing protein [Brevirhabdus sp.]|uniref:DUF3576 domain-containing protein n=1 Tax=Brevirhabdus sp. TaxID=2004514 RepID=UPI0040593A1C